MSFEPLVERGFSAPEVVETMLLSERLGAPVGHALLGNEDVWLGEELFELGLRPRRAIENLDESRPVRRVERELRSIREHALGLDHGCIDDEVGQRPVRGLSGLP